MVPEPEDISDNLLNISIRSKEERGYLEERSANGKKIRYKGIIGSNVYSFNQKAIYESGDLSQIVLIILVLLLNLIISLRVMQGAKGK